MATSQKLDDHAAPEPYPDHARESKRHKDNCYNLTEGVGDLVMDPPYEELEEWDKKERKKTLRDIIRWEGMWIAPDDQVIDDYVDCFPEEYRPALRIYYKAIRRTLGFELPELPPNASIPFQLIVPAMLGHEVTQQLRLCHQEAVRYLNTITSCEYESGYEDILSSNWYMYSYSYYFITFTARNTSSSITPAEPQTFQAAVSFEFFNYRTNYINPNDYEVRVHFIRLKPN